MAFAGRAALLDKPMSVEQIVKAAAEPFFDPEFSVQNWFRTADLMLKQANIYEHEGNDQMAYFLLYRHAHLILDELTKHPLARAPEYRTTWSEARKAVKRSLAKLEILQPKINKRYARYEERRRSMATPGKTQKPSLADGMRKLSLDTSGSRSPSRHRDDSPARLDAVEHGDMAVELANREMNRRARGAASSVQDQQNLGTSLVNLRRQLEAPTSRPRHVEPSSVQPRASAYSYPTVPEKHDLLREDPLPLYNPRNHSQLTSTLLPPRPPPKEYRQPPSPGPPPVPTKANIPAPSTAPPTNHQFATTSCLESGAPLRTIFLPTPLRHSFTQHASQNTLANLETCGILLGTLLHNAFFITHLVIPAQTSTSDTCEMLDEAALHAYIDSHPNNNADLMVLGWIHTHPSQTCFMSSRDLHTHVWYQVQLPESIAIVCAPSKSPDWGVFRLTEPPGVQAIRGCKQPGIFHPHAEGRLFTDALGRPGHVVEHEGLQFEVVDLRPAK